MVEEIVRNNIIKDAEHIWEFTYKVIETCKGAKHGVRLAFQCPICNNEASAFISPSNGHKHARCTACGIKVSS